MRNIKEVGYWVQGIGAFNIQYLQQKKPDQAEGTWSG